MVIGFAAWLSSSEVSSLPKKVAVGWSGGADSTALLLALKEAGHTVQAWHVDHGWRETSRQECKLLSEQAAAWGIPFIAKRLERETHANREAAAREGRFSQFQVWGREHGITTLCLGHHRDDQAETVCIRLLQGAGVGGCRGIQYQRIRDGLNIVRPLLHVSGKELRTMLQKNGVAWFEDPSNQEMDIWRNRIRHQLFPRIADEGVDPVRLFMRWQRQAERLAKELDAGADQVLRNCDLPVSEKEKSIVALPWRQWVESSPPVRARVLQRMMVSLLGEGVTPGRRHIMLVEQWTGRSGRGGLDLSRCRLQRKQGQLHLLPAVPVCANNPV